MGLIDGDGNSYSDMADFHLQLADSGQQMSDEKFFNPVIQRESNWETGKANWTGSNKGLGQYGPEEMKRYHITDPDSPEQTYRAMRMERGEQQGILRQKGYKGEYGPGQFGLIHNQGLGGGPAILTADPNAKMGDVLKPFYPGKSVKFLNQVIGQRANWGDVNTPVGQWRDYASQWYAGGHPQRPRITVTPSHYDDMPTDRNHDIPLIAGARMSDDGEYKGIYMDRSIPDTMTIGDGTNSKTIPSDQFVKLHEWEEVQDMERPGGTLSKSGSGKAYSMSHSTVATPREQAAVEKWASDNGLEPKKTWKNYQEFWKNALSVTEKNPPEKVPSDLYLHPYDGHKYQKEMEELSGRSIANHPKLREDQIAGKESIGKKPDIPPRQQQTRTKGQYTSLEQNPTERGSIEDTLKKEFKRQPLPMELDKSQVKHTILDATMHKETAIHDPDRPAESNTVGDMLHKAAVATGAYRDPKRPIGQMLQEILQGMMNVLPARGPIPGKAMRMTSMAERNIRPKLEPDPVVRGMKEEGQLQKEKHRDDDPRNERPDDIVQPGEPLQVPRPTEAPRGWSHVDPGPEQYRPLSAGRQALRDWERGQGGMHKGTRKGERAGKEFTFKTNRGLTSIINEHGEEVGYASHRQRGTDVHVGGMFSNHSERGTLGPAAVRAFYKHLGEKYPNATHIEATRVSGARQVSGRGTESVRIPIKRK